MRINIISNIDNGHGLQRDYEILRDILLGAGHQVDGVRYDHMRSAQKAEINIFLEMALPVFDEEAENWLIPNPEWFHSAYMANLPKYSRVLCKTHDAFSIFRGLHPCAEYVGFESIDFYRPEIKKQRRFLHVAGKSEMKGTSAIIEAWESYRIKHPLTIISSRSDHAAAARGADIKLLPRIPEDQFVELLNSCAFILCPSQCEGWGHSIYEAMGAGAVVITTDAAPMNECGVDQEFLVPSTPDKKMRLGTLCKVDPERIAAKIRSVAIMTGAAIETISRHNRESFLRRRDEFRERLLFAVNSCERRLECAS